MEETAAVENCPVCGMENYYPNWQCETQGYTACCEHCGAYIKLCDMCLHAEDNPDRKCDQHMEHIKHTGNRYKGGKEKIITMKICFRDQYLTQKNNKNIKIIDNDTDYICAILPEEERLCQLAQEASELARKALTYRHTLTVQTNPTSKSKAKDELIEELASVLAAAEICRIYNTPTKMIDNHILKVKKDKLKRWAKWLEAEAEREKI